MHEAARVVVSCALSCGAAAWACGGVVGSEESDPSSPAIPPRVGSDATSGATAPQLASRAGATSSGSVLSDISFGTPPTESSNDATISPSRFIVGAQWYSSDAGSVTSADDGRSRVCILPCVVDYYRRCLPPSEAECISAGGGVVATNEAVGTYCAPGTAHSWSHSSFSMGIALSASESSYFLDGEPCLSVFIDTSFGGWSIRWEDESGRRIGSGELLDPNDPDGATVGTCYGSDGSVTGEYEIDRYDPQCESLLQSLPAVPNNCVDGTCPCDGFPRSSAYLYCMCGDISDSDFFTCLQNFL